MNESEPTIWITICALCCLISLLLFMILANGCGEGVTLDSYCQGTCETGVLCLIESDPSIVGSESVTKALRVCKEKCTDVGRLRESVEGPVDWRATLEVFDGLTCDDLLEVFGL